jgi:hypothetical protein
MACSLHTAGKLRCLYIATVRPQSPTRWGLGADTETQFTSAEIACYNLLPLLLIEQLATG